MAGRAYFEAQRLIFKTQCDLSVYRFQLSHLSHVAVLGLPPPDELERKLTSILSSGEPLSLPADLLAFLQARRRQAIRQAPWTERHYRPGRQL